MRAECYRRGQGEVGIVTNDGRVYAAFGASVSGHNVTAYTRNDGGVLALTRRDVGTMLACRSETVREYHDGPLAIVFRLTNGRYIAGFALGDEGMLFRGELLLGCDDERARREAVALAEYWSQIDAEDEADPRHGEPDEPDEGEVFTW
jgi:hypothetical protein